MGPDRHDKEHTELRRAYDALFAPIWEDTDRKVGEMLHSPWVTPHESRKQIQSTFLRDSGVLRLDPRKKAGQRELARAFRKHAIVEVAQGIAALKRNLPWMDRRVVQALLRPPTATASEARSEAYRTEAAYHRNLQLLTFVAERALPRDQVRRGELRPGHRGPAVAVPWDELARQWNEDHRRPFFESGRTLSRAYYRAIARDCLRRDFLVEMGRQEFSAFTYVARSFGFSTEPEPPIRRRPEAARRWPKLQSASTWRRYVRAAVLVWFITRREGDIVPRITRRPSAREEHLKPPAPMAVREMNRCLKECCRDGELQSHLSAHLLYWFCTQKHSSLPIRAAPRLSADDLGHPERGSW